MAGECSMMMDNLKSNLQYWKTMVEQRDEAARKNAAAAAAAAQHGGSA
jgi:molybdopterin synthase catalytic subunit